MHVNWLPNLADDLYYEYLGGRTYIENIGTVGGHIIFLNLGEQTQTDEFLTYVPLSALQEFGDSLYCNGFIGDF